MSALTIRRDAAQATLDAFLNKRVRWGKYDCVRLAAHTLKGLGHNPALIRGGYYRSESTAILALKRAGFDATEAAMDDMGFERIPPAAALPGDVIGYADGTHTLTALSVAMGNGRVLGFLADMICHVAPATLGVEGATYVAWRCEPRT